MEKASAPLSTCASEVLDVLKKNGSMPTPDIYKYLPSYKVGDCEVDIALSELHTRGLIFANGKRSSGDSSWGTCIVWQAKESST